MDESWRMRMGIASDQGCVAKQRRHPEVAPLAPPVAELEPEDFDDVFGGPPRSMLARKLSADFSGCSDLFYQEIFRQLEEDDFPAKPAGRRLPEFVIPEGRRRESRSSKMKCMSKSKSTSSSMLSFEDVIGDEGVALGSYTSRVRPVKVQGRWSSSSTSTMLRPKHNKQDLPAFGCSSTNHFTNNDQFNSYVTNSTLNYNYGYPQRVTSPETSEPTSLYMETAGHKIQLNSPSLMVSSVCDVPEEKMVTFNYDEQAEHAIEMNPCTMEVNNSEGIDVNEAIAWAKEKFQGWSLDGDASHKDQGDINLIFEEMQHDY